MDTQAHSSALHGNRHNSRRQLALKQVRHCSCDGFGTPSRERACCRRVIIGLLCMFAMAGACQKPLDLTFAMSAPVRQQGVADRAAQACSKCVNSLGEAPQTAVCMFVAYECSRMPSGHARGCLSSNGADVRCPHRPEGVLASAQAPMSLRHGTGIANAHLMLEGGQSVECCCGAASTRSREC